MPATAERPRDAPLRALVVEDEGLIALLMEDYLHAMGVAEVVLAQTLEKGLREARQGRFDLAVLDVNLRGARSDPVADALAERGVPFTFATGYGPGGVPARHADRPVVTKPAQFADLQAAVAGLLEWGT